MYVRTYVHRDAAAVAYLPAYLSFKWRGKSSVLGVGPPRPALNEPSLVKWADLTRLTTGPSFNVGAHICGVVS